jgi:hypothetical protein
LNAALEVAGVIVDEVLVIALFDSSVYEAITTHRVFAIIGAGIVVALICVVALFNTSVYEAVAATRYATRREAAIAFFCVGVVARLVAFDDTISTKEGLGLAYLFKGTARLFTIKETISIVIERIATLKPCFIRGLKGVEGTSKETKHKEEDQAHESLHSSKFGQIQYLSRGLLSFHQGAVLRLGGSPLTTSR